MKKSIFTVLFILIYIGIEAQETCLQNIRKLTNGGDNAEAYFSPDGNSLTMQVTNPSAGILCDQIFLYNLRKQPHSSENLQMISTGKGRTTCSYFLPDGQHILYASTHSKYDSCPPPVAVRPDGKYLWAIYPDYDIYIADLKGNIVKQLTNTPGYDAEAVVSPDGKKIVFTSIRSGDLELWTMNIDGTDQRQITNGLGYDGGAFFSHDSKKLVFRASRPRTEKEIYEYTELLKENLVAPVAMEIYTCNVDGTCLKQITHLGKANWAPFFHPSDNKIIFSSNYHSTKGYDFQLYMIDTAGENLRQITWESNFNAFPMFSPDGKRLVFSSNRQQGAPRETNVFIADWVDPDEAESAQIENIKKHINFLADDKLQGRLAGSEGAKEAASYIKKIFVSLRLKPAFKKGYLQKFSYVWFSNPHDSSEQNKITVNTENIVAYLDNNASKTIIIGAHYDHLGLNDHNNSTLPNSKGLIHNGADDNASGVAGVLELARMFSNNKQIEKANFVFVCFSGEEDGLQGSKYFAEGVKKQFPGVAAMINMDMIGRLDSSKSLIVGGIGTSPDFAGIIEKNKPAGYNITLDSSGIGPTDHTSFYLKDIPVLNFFTGTHNDYHKPTDDAGKIKYTNEKQIIDYVFRTAITLANVDSIPFRKTKISAGKKTPVYKVTLGIMPNYTDKGDGLHIDAVIDNRPAAKAGLLAGDIITKISDCEIKEVYSYMDCLSRCKPGQEVIVQYIRDGIKGKTTVVF